MAETMTKKKTTTTAKKETVAVEKTPKTETKTYAPTDEVDCLSVTSGELILIGKKTGNLYRWMNYGDVTPVEYQDLKAEKLNRLSRYIYDPLFMINDEELLATSEFAAVADVYQNMLSIDDIDNIFDMDIASFKKTIQNLPIGLKNTIKSLAATKIQDGSLDSVRKIKELDSILGTDLFNGYLGV